MSDISQLREKRARIAKLEREHKVIGISFAVREGAKVPINEAMDYVAEQIEKSAELIKHRRDLINHGRSSPK
jgi:hypothetical protein